MPETVLTARAKKAQLQAIEDARFTVGEASFERLEDAAQEASRASAGEKRIQITTVMQRPIQGGYGGISRVVASFFNGYDLNSIAADEDGVPDLGLRATALVHKPVGIAGKKPRP